MRGLGFNAGIELLTQLRYQRSESKASAVRVLERQAAAGSLRRVERRSADLQQPSPSAAEETRSRRIAYSHCTQRANPWAAELNRPA